MQCASAVAGIHASSTYDHSANAQAFHNMVSCIARYTKHVLTAGIFHQLAIALSAACHRSATYSACVHMLSGGGGDEPPAGGQVMEEEEEPDEEQVSSGKASDLL